MGEKKRKFDSIEEEVTFLRRQVAGLRNRNNALNVTNKELRQKIQALLDEKKEGEELLNKKIELLEEELKGEKNKSLWTRIFG